ncbi:hypothetical protein [Christiangramia sp.]|uniref:hypothetical protein n=1 Tax=Christiangramia sp. TaxID=1931228 RepID=UPI0026189852|nr:hypothetical protein [Christiangramia sp.]
MKITIYITLVCLVLSGCSAFKADPTKEAHEKLLENPQTYKNFRGYEPVDPVEFEEKILIADGNSFLVSKDIKLLNREEILGFLNNETVLVSIAEISREGDFNYLPISFSRKNTSYKVTMDYMKYATLAQVSDTQFIGSKRVGVGLRLISLITTAESGINISDLYSIGLAAKAGKLSGTLIIEVIGIKSKEVTTLIPLPSEINQTTIQNAMQALATIKSKIYDEETSLYPQVMAIKEYENKKVQLVENNMENNLKTLEEFDDRGIQLQFGNIKFSSEARKEEASQLLSGALKSILEKNLDRAIAELETYHQEFPQYSLNGLMDKLLKNRKALLNKNASEWKEVYEFILINYQERLSYATIEKLKNP